MIRFQCRRCGKRLAVQDSRAGTAGACPHCKESLRIPREDASPAEPEQDAGETLAFSRWGLTKALAWWVSFQLLVFLLMIGAPVGVVVIFLKEQITFQVLLGVATIVLMGVVGFCYFFMALPNWRLFFLSTIPSSSHYRVRSDRLVRYSRANVVVEEVPFANVANVRLLTRRNVENPEITAKVLGIDLRNPDDRATTLDRHFCRWSRKMHRHDLVMVPDFFDEPIKTVYRKIKKSFERWQESHPASAKDVESSARPRTLTAWYQKPLTYLLAGVGLLGMAGLVGVVLLVSLLVRGKDERKADVPVANAAERFGPASLPGLLAYWPLDEGQGQAVKDASGNGAHGQIRGGEWHPGDQGSALRLRGKGDFVDLGAAAQLNFGAAAGFTLAGWNATDSNGVLCSFRSQASIHPIIEMSVRQGHLFGWVRDDTSGFGGAKVTGGLVNDGKWHHVALLRESDGTIELFLDGASQGRSKGKSSGGPITTDLRTLGCDRFLLSKEKPPGYLAGDFKEICVYNRSLSAAEIASLAGRKP